MKSLINRYYKTDLRRSLKTSWLIVAILVIGLLGPLISSLLRSSIENFLTQNSRSVLTADIAVTAYRPIRDDEIERISQKFGVRRKVREIEFVTMTTGRSNQTALLEVHAVESGFPIDGAFELSDGRRLQVRPELDSVWMSADALASLGLRVGDSLNFGKAKFKIENSIKLAPGISRAAFGFAPRAYIAIENANATGLLGFGSQVYFRTYLETVKPVISTEDVRTALGDPDLFLRTPDDSVQGIEQVTKFMSLYLAVVSISLFVLGSMAAFYILRTQAIERMRSAAIALVFGATSRSMLFYEFIRITGLTLLSALIAFLLAWTIAIIVEPVIANALAQSVSGEFHIHIAWTDLLMLIVTTLAASVIFTIPFASRLSSSNLNDLFHDSAVSVAPDRVFSSQGKWLARYANHLVGLLAGLLLTGLSIWLTRDLKIGSQFAAGFAITVLVIHMAGVLTFEALAKLFSRGRGKVGSLLRLVGTQLSRARFAVRLSFLAIGLSTFVASAVGQIMISLASELKGGAQLERTPDFFLFNIPESDLGPLEALLAKENTKLDFISPMILARLKDVNGRPTNIEQFQKFPLRITWRDRPIPSEVIVEGPAILQAYRNESGQSKVLPAISVESRFADRNEFKLGDRLLFDVQGVPIEGYIANLRRVRWTDFNPNFFISFQPGVLEDAPKTWLGNVRVKNRDDRSRIQSAIVREFPDLSVIDVSQTLERVVGLMRATLGPAEQAAWLATIFSVLVLLTIVSHSVGLRGKEMNLFRILGAEPRRVSALYRLEFAIASGMGSLFGATCGLVLAGFVSIRFLELDFQIDAVRFAMTICAGFILGTSLGSWLYARVSRGLGFSRRVV